MSSHETCGGVGRLLEERICQASYVCFYFKFFNPFEYPAANSFSTLTVLRTYVDLRDWLHLNHLTIRTISYPAACFDSYSMGIVDASALSIAVALIPAERPEYNVMSHDNWLERIDIDFRNVFSSPITLSGKPRQWAVKLEEDFNELLAQIATLKRNVSRAQLSDKEFGLWMDDYDPTKVNGVALVVGLIDPSVKPTFAAGKGDWRFRYRSEWESDLDQKAGVRVRFEPFVEA
ncbi:hypothetical protein K474DRAFT_1664316 [Panus rudis PR-1116 ss-1]|nr:hypothetical protein K474DRAFT_1664316 [Panus rudis PR-1116 ss-1]